MFNRCRKMRDWIDISEVDFDPQQDMINENPIRKKIPKNTLRKNEELILDQWFARILNEYTPYLTKKPSKTKT